MTDMHVGANTTQLVPTTLPGLGGTYLDQSMVPRVNAFIENAAAHGVQLHFNSAYRTPEHQAALHGDPNAITPADNSLHPAGFAVDVNYASLPVDQREVIRNAATAAGLQWGGDFHSADPPHFYTDPPIDRAAAIANATRQYHEQVAPQVTQPPAPASTQEQSHDSPLPNQPHAARGTSVPAAATSAQATARPRLDDAMHPDNPLFRQAQARVYALDASVHRTPDGYSDNFAAALTVQAKAKELRGIHHLALSNDRSRAFVIDTPNVDDVHRRIAHVDVLPAINQPIEESTRQIAQVNATLEQKAQQLGQTQQQAPAMQQGRG